jgi:hypothetical protein
LSLRSALKMQFAVFAIRFRPAESTGPPSQFGPEELAELAARIVACRVVVPTSL